MSMSFIRLLQTAALSGLIGAGAATAETWEVVDLGDVDIVGPPLVVFGPDGLLAVDTGCNRLVGGAATEGNALKIGGPMAATKMACPEDLARQEDALLRLFSGAVEFTFDPFSSTLMLSANGIAASLKPAADTSED